MLRRLVLTGAILVAALIGSSATAVALNASGRGSDVKVSASANRVTAARRECRLSELRVVGIIQTSGYSAFGTRSQYLLVRFINNGPTCSIDSRSSLRLSATTNTGVAVRAKLSAMSIQVPHSEAVAIHLATWWKIGRAPAIRYSCPSVAVRSVIFDGDGGPVTVSLGSHPLNVCTPLKSELLVTAN